MTVIGAGTMALEILDQVPDVDVILVPVGGCGLIAGISLAVKTLKPSCKVSKDMHTMQYNTKQNKTK